MILQRILPRSCDGTSQVLCVKSGPNNIHRGLSSGSKPRTRLCKYRLSDCPCTSLSKEPLQSKLDKRLCERSGCKQALVDFTVPHEPNLLRFVSGTDAGKQLLGKRVLIVVSLLPVSNLTLFCDEFDILSGRSRRHAQNASVGLLSPLS